MDSVTLDAVGKAIPVLLVIVAILVGVLKHRHAQSLQRLGVQWLLALRLLITHMQRHRGLSAAVLKGDRKMLEALEEAQSHISRDMAHILSIGEWAAQQPEWQNLVQHWDQLSVTVMRLDARQAFEQHNRLIQTALVLVDEVARTHYLNRVPGRTASLWRELLMLAELVGRVRATGMALAAGADASNASVLATRRQLDELIKDAYQLLELPAYAVGLDETLLQNTMDFLRYTDESFLRQDMALSASHYYKTATEALDEIYDRFDRELGMVRQRLRG